MIEIISKYIVVTHCTSDIEILNSSINDGNVTFIAVSINTPQNVIIPVAKMARNSLLLTLFVLFKKSLSFIFLVKLRKKEATPT